MDDDRDDLKDTMEELADSVYSLPAARRRRIFQGVCATLAAGFVLWIAWRFW